MTPAQQKLGLEALKRAIDHVGTQAEFARRLNKPERPVTPSHVWNWINRDKKVPPEQVLPIEALAEGKAPRHELRADLYPEEKVA